MPVPVGEGRLQVTTGKRWCCVQSYMQVCQPEHENTAYKMLSYRRETVLQGTLVLARSGRLELGDNILRTL